MRLRAAASVLLLIGALLLNGGPVNASEPGGQTVSFDKYSMMIGGHRTFIWSGEMHPYRIPSPDLWRDVLQKMKASGYNAVSFYFDWGYHSPKPGVYDFTGVRDMDRLLTIADEVGLYVIARPGPYINAEVDGGGFPGWLTTQAGRARSDAPDYLAATDEWQSAIDAVIARHQLTDGTGSVILYQIENELAVDRHLAAQLPAAPLRQGPRRRHPRADLPQRQGPQRHLGAGQLDRARHGARPGRPVRVRRLPGRHLPHRRHPGLAQRRARLGHPGSGRREGRRHARRRTRPGFTAEFGGGWFDYWGSVGTYPCTAVRQGPGYERVFYGTNIANRLTVQNFYMTFGGTSWGWLPAPVVYTSYDYGAAIDEARQLRPKAVTMKSLGYFVQSVAPLTKVDKGAGRADLVAGREDRAHGQPGHRHELLLRRAQPVQRHHRRRVHLPDRDRRRHATPRALRLTGQDAKTLVADYDVEGHHLVYSTSEIETHAARCAAALRPGRRGRRDRPALRRRSRSSGRSAAAVDQHLRPGDR